AAAAYYTSPWKSESVLVFTCDGSGDRLSATVSIGRAGSLKRIAEVSEHDSLGRLYALVTRHPGMAPLEHEYKVMGLAPYAGNAREVEVIAREFEALFEFSKDSLTWQRRSGVSSMYSGTDFVRRLLAGKRFDWIAGGAQRFLETMLTRWVR